MRLTRLRTGKLPARVVREDVVSDFEDNEPLPSLSASMSPVSADQVETLPILESILPKEPKNIFQVVRVNKKLEDGLCLVRALGHGRYELVNLKNVNHDEISSEETGVMIKADEQRLNAFKLDKKEWDAAAFKCHMAVGSANKAIFRFRSLPLELRYRVYDFAIVGVKALYRVSGATQKTLALALRGTCKQFYGETESFFYKNSFRVDAENIRDMQIPPKIQDNLKEVTFQWWGWTRKDRSALNLLRSFRNVKILNLIVTEWIFLSGTHLAEPASGDLLAKFRQSRGFMDICDLRGFETVRVSNEGVRKAQDAHITPAELKAFEDHLNEQLTKARWKSVAVKKARALKISRAAAAEAKAKKSKRANWDDDSEYDEAFLWQMSHGKILSGPTPSLSALMEEALGCILSLRMCYGGWGVSSPADFGTRFTSFRLFVKALGTKDFTAVVVFAISQRSQGSYGPAILRDGWEAKDYFLAGRDSTSQADGVIQSACRTTMLDVSKAALSFGKP
ncbi:unnamed protein product [Diplocarpon coronariae]